MSQYKYSDQEIKIAEWLGFKWQPSRHYSEDPHWTWTRGGVERFPRTSGGIPHFREASAAVYLLPELEERNYDVILTNKKKNKILPGAWSVTVYQDGAELFTYTTPHIAQSICDAVEAVIDREREQG